MHFKDPCLNGNCCMLACQLAGKNVIQRDAWNGEIMVPSHMTFVVQPTCWPVYYCSYIYGSLFGFMTMCPDIVLLTLFSCNEALLSCVLPVPLSLTAVCLFILLFYVCLLMNNFIGGLLIVLFTCIVYVSHLLVVYIAGFLLILFSISASGSVFMLDCLLNWCCRYVSAVTVVGFMCPLFLEMCLLFFVS